MEINLTPEEMLHSGTVGLKRQIESLLSNRQMRYRSGNDDGWRNHIEGAMAELAAAKALKLHWPATINNFHGADIGEKIQIRLRLNGGRLIVRERDKDDHWFSLVTGGAPKYDVVGYIKGADAKKEDWLDDPQGKGFPCYWVPYHALKRV